MKGNPAFDAKESPAKVMQLSPFVQGNRSKRKEQWQQEKRLFLVLPLFQKDLHTSEFFFFMQRQRRLHFMLISTPKSLASLALTPSVPSFPAFGLSYGHFRLNKSGSPLVFSESLDTIGLA